jgi:predicted AAA+ superfamily ATPase
MCKTTCMRQRTYWRSVIEKAWERKSVVWLHGVRRVGKTVLCQSLDQVEYLDCERPRTRRLLEDPEGFLESVRGKRVILDEVQRLANPSELLKIAADHYRDVRIIATGSSTLQASAKFRDTLTGRKSEVWLTPMMTQDLSDFDDGALPHRLQWGGLPGFFLSPELPERDYDEWMDSYWARDIQELFRLERRSSFQRLLELLLAQSGGVFEATRLAGPCEISRPTVTSYLDVLEATSVVHVIRPFSTHRATEIVSAPKVYGFDTGFVCHFRGWTDLRPEDLGGLWEHYVLNEIHARTQGRSVNYWRDKQHHEIDFVLARRGRAPITIECKWSASGFDVRNLRSFRYQYPEGENWVVAQDVDRPYERTIDDVRVEFIGTGDLASRLGKIG